MYEYIPESIRMDSFAYKEVSSEKFSMFEMISKNVRGVDTRSRVQELLRRMYDHDMQAFDTVSLATYLSDNGSALSTDVMMAYFSPMSYDNAKDIFDKAKSLLSEYNVILTEDEADQDFFLLRSKLFAYYANDILVKDRRLKGRYGIVIEKFIHDVMPYRIFRYDIFRRKAFDRVLFVDLYGDHANDIYSYLYNYDQNPYTLQQWALCRADLKQYPQAFIDIDKALSQRPYNFSMKNSQAIILFEANMEQGTSLSIEKMKEAMEILRTCYNNDKRKVYHAQKYAEFSIRLTDRYAVNQYLNEALRWIDEISQHGDSVSRRTKYLREELDKRIK